MKKFYQTIVNNPKKILACFLLLAAIGAVLSGMVGVNYDIKDYLRMALPLPFPWMSWRKNLRVASPTPVWQ